MTNLIVKRLFDKQIIKPCGPRASKNSQSIEYKLSDDQDFNLKSKSLIMASELVLQVKSANMNIRVKLRKCFLFSQRRGNLLLP